MTSMPYSIREESKPGSKEIEFVVVAAYGVVPPPNTFSTRDEALARIAELERLDLELIAEWEAAEPKSAVQYVGTVKAASPAILIQHVGLGKHIVHRRTEALAEVEVDDDIEVRDGQVNDPDRRQPGRGMSR